MKKNIFLALITIICLGLAGLLLKEKNLLMFSNNDAEPKRTILKLEPDNSFTFIGYSYQTLSDGNYNYHDLSDRIKGGTRISFSTKEIIPDAVDILEEQSVVEIFQDDFGVNLIEVGKNDPNFISLIKKEEEFLNKLSNVKLFMNMKKAVYNGLSVSLKNKKILVDISSASPVSRGTNEIYIKAKIKYIASDPSSREEIFKGKLSDISNGQNIFGDNKEKQLSLNTSGLYGFTLDDKNSAPSDINTIRKSLISTYEISSNLDLIDIVITDANGVNVNTSQYKSNERSFSFNDIREFNKNDSDITNLEKISENVPDVNIEIRYKTTTVKELDLSQTIGFSGPVVKKN